MSLINGLSVSLVGDDMLEVGGKKEPRVPLCQVGGPETLTLCLALVRI